MNHPPILETERLVLRPFQISDAARVKALAGAPQIYRTTLNIPHPYEDGMAEKWIASHASRFYQGDAVNLAVTLKTDGILVGAIGLDATLRHQRAELGYWIGVPYWGKGYCTEGAIAVIRYGFTIMNYHKITSSHMECNPASGRVMEKAGMRQEGILIDEVMKDGRYHTMIVYGIIDSEQRHAADTAIEAACGGGWVCGWFHSDRCGGDLARALASVPAATPSLEPLDACNVTVVGGIAE